MGAIDYLPHYSYADYKEWEGKWELYEGYPIAMSPAPMINHQAIAFELARELANNIEGCDRCLVLCEEDWKLSDDTVLRPDVVLICDEPHDAYITKAPEIIVEVISKSTAKRDENLKFTIYAGEGVKYYILIYPEDLVAKVYKNHNFSFRKVGEFDSEIVEFSEIKCEFSFDFDSIFKRFRE